MIRRTSIALWLSLSVACAGSGDGGATTKKEGTPSVDASAPARPAAADPLKWRKLAPLAKARLAHTATRLADGRVLVVGGEDAEQRMLASTEIFDPTTETWRAGPDLPAPRANHVATLLPDGRVLVAGGGKSTPTGQPLGEAVTADAVFFDPKAETFSPAPSMHEPRSHFQAVTLASGDLLVAGGADMRTWVPEDCGNAPYCGPFGTAIAGAERFDPKANVWSRVSPMNVARMSFAIAKLASGRVIATGGIDDRGKGTKSTEIFDPSTGAWTVGPELVGPPREHHTSIATGGGTVLVVGGKNPNVRPLATIEVFDEARSEWKNGPFLSEARTMPSLATLESGRVLITGGFAQLASVRGDSGSVRESLIFEEGRAELTKSADLGEGRVLHTSTLLADGRVLVVGGHGEAGELRSVEIGEAQ